MVRDIRRETYSHPAHHCPVHAVGTNSEIRAKSRCSELQALTKVAPQFSQITSPNHFIGQTSSFKVRIVILPGLGSIYKRQQIH
jgi:hypothetical protein